MFYSNIIADNKYIKNYAIYLIIPVIIGAAVTLGWFAYSWHINKIEQAAFRDLAETIDEYNKKINLADLERAFKVGAKRHQNSKLEPYFLAYQANILLNQEKYTQAIEILDLMLNMLNKNNPLYYPYATKYALAKIDSGDSNLVNQGIQELKILSQDKDNNLQNMALYYLGLNALYKNNKEEAKQLWQAVINKSGEESGWAHMAKIKLEAI